MKKYVVLALTLVLCMSLTACGLKDQHIHHYETTCQLRGETVDAGVILPIEQFGDQTFSMTPLEFTQSMEGQLNLRREVLGEALTACWYYENDCYYLVIDRGEQHMITIVLYNKEGRPGPQESQNFQVATLLATDGDPDFNNLILRAFMIALDPSLDDEKINTLFAEFAENDSLVMENNGYAFCASPGEDGLMALHMGTVPQ